MIYTLRGFKRFLWVAGLGGSLLGLVSLGIIAYRESHPLPSFIPTLYGRVPVLTSAEPKHKNRSADGLWFRDSRVIVVRTGLPPGRARVVLEHERCHVALHDFDVFMPDSLEERVCDAMLYQYRIGQLAKERD